MTPSPMFDLSGRVALVTGAARGLGLAIAGGLAQAGATVVLNGRNAAALIAARASLPAGSHTDIAVFDVTARATIADGLAAVAQKHGAIDILVNNAGINLRHPIVDFNDDDWDKVIATNLTAPFSLARAVVPLMQSAKRGSIINIASLTSELARPNIVAYTAAKGGVRQLTRALAVELGAQGIRVNAIAPGYFITDMNQPLLDNPEFVAWVNMRTPMKRWGEPKELAGIAVFLASDAASYVTGQTIFVDGGVSINL